jgi:hypothetical protein
MIETAAVLLTWILLLVGTLDLGLVLFRHNLMQRLAVPTPPRSSSPGAPQRWKCPSISPMRSRSSCAPWP